MGLQTLVLTCTQSDSHELIYVWKPSTSALARARWLLSIRHYNDLLKIYIYSQWAVVGRDSGWGSSLWSWRPQFAWLWFLLTLGRTAKEGTHFLGKQLGKTSPDPSRWLTRMLPVLHHRSEEWGEHTSLHLWQRVHISGTLHAACWHPWHTIRSLAASMETRCHLLQVLTAIAGSET